VNRKYLPILVYLTLFLVILSTLLLVPEAILNGKSTAAFWIKVGSIACLSLVGSQITKKFKVPDLFALIFVALLLSPRSGLGLFSLEISELAWIAVIFKILQNGFSLNIRLAVVQWKPALLVGLFSFLAPLSATVILGELVTGGLFGSTSLYSESFYTPSFFFACALAFSVAPLALIDDILDTANIRRTPFGTVVTSSQVLNELISWAIFSVVAGKYLAGEHKQVFGPVTQSFSLVALVLAVGGLSYFYGNRISGFLSKKQLSSYELSSLVTMGVVFSSAVLEKLFHGGIICALLLGVFVGSIPYAGVQVKKVGANFVKIVCLPLFFYNSFKNVNVFADFSLELFLTTMFLGVLPSFLGCYFGAWLSGRDRKDRRRLGVAGSAIGISSLIMADFLLVDNAPGKAEFMSGLALAIPLTSLVCGLLLRKSFGQINKTSLKASFGKTGVKLLKPEYEGAAGFLMEELIHKSFVEHSEGDEISKNNLILLNSIFNTSLIKEYEPGKKYSMVTIPTPAKVDKMTLEIYLAQGTQMEMRGEQLEVLFALWYPADNTKTAAEVTAKAPLFIEALEEDRCALVKRIVKCREEINPLETITGYLEDLDASVSEMLVDPKKLRAA